MSMKINPAFVIIFCLLAALTGCGNNTVSETAAGQKPAADQSAVGSTGAAADQGVAGNTGAAADQGTVGNTGAAADQSAVGSTGAAADQSAVGNTGAAAKSGAGETGAVQDEDVQLQLIADLSKEWFVENEYEEYWYAVTDLDRDGNLEMIAATTQGSGLYTWFSVYEVSGDRTGLNLLPTTLKEGDSGPDLIVDSAPALERDGIIYYYFEDVLRFSAYEHLLTKETLSLEDDRVVIRPIASAHTGPELDENGEPIEDAMMEELFDSENRKITLEEFDSLTKIPDDSETIGFGWTDLKDGISVEALRRSFNAFKPL